MKAPPYDHFRLGIAAPNSAHIQLPLLRRQNIDHLISKP
jgi:hypothetical protein